MIPHTHRGPLLVCLALVSCGPSKYEQGLAREAVAIPLARETQSGGYDLITTDELNHLLAAKTRDFVLIDAMPKASFARGHIAGAVNFAFPTNAGKGWPDPGGEIGGTRADFTALLGSDKAKRLIFYCAFVECPRSHHAASWAKKLGYESVTRYAGGLFAWQGAQHALVAAK